MPVGSARGDPQQGAGPSSDVGNLDRDGGEGPAWRAGPSGDVVGGRHRDPPGPGLAACLAGGDGRRPGTRPPAGLLDREQGGQQLLARADAAAGASGRGSTTARSSSGRAASGGVSTYQDTIVRPNLPDRTESSESSLLEAEGLVGNRQMTVRVDGRGSTYDIYFPDGRPAFLRPPARGRQSRRAARISARSSAAWPSAGGSTGSPSARPGIASSNTRAPPTC